MSKSIYPTCWILYQLSDPHNEIITVNINHNLAAVGSLDDGLWGLHSEIKWCLG